MSGNSNHPVPVSAVPVDDMREPSEIANWAPSGEGPRQDVGPKIQRYVSALYRFKWLILLMTILGAAGGYVATGFIVPQYQVDSTISMGLDANINAARGQDDGLMDRDSWQDLLKTFRVADPVVTKLALYLVPKKDRDSTAFRDFRFRPRWYPGNTR